MKDKTTDNQVRGALHYRRTRWFKDYRGVTKHTLHQLALRNVVREIRDGKARLSPLAWCVEDYDRHVADEKRIMKGCGR